MNKVILTGNLCRDVDIAQTPSGKEVVQNCIAVKRDYKNANGEYDSDFINIVVWGVQAQYLNNYAHKGDRVELVGRWQVRKYEKSDGTKQIAHECVVESITALGNKPKEEPKKLPLEEMDGSDLPF